MKSKMKTSLLLLTLVLLVAACGSSLDGVAAKAADATCRKVDETRDGLALVDALLADPGSDAVELLKRFAESRGLEEVATTCALYSAANELAARRKVVTDAIASGKAMHEELSQLRQAANSAEELLGYVLEME